MNIRAFLKNVVTDDINITVKHNAHQDGIVVRTKKAGSPMKEVWISNELIFDPKVRDEQFKEYLLDSLKPLIQ